MSSNRRLAWTISRSAASIVARSVVVPKMAAASRAISGSISTDVFDTLL